MFDSLSNKRVIKDGAKGKISNCVSVLVYWDNGNITNEILGNLESDEEGGYMIREGGYLTDLKKRLKEAGKKGEIENENSII